MSEAPDFAAIEAQAQLTEKTLGAAVVAAARLHEMVQGLGKSPDRKARMAYNKFGLMRDSAENSVEYLKGGLDFLEQVQK